MRLLVSSEVRLYVRVQHNGVVVLFIMGAATQSSGSKDFSKLGKLLKVHDGAVLGVDGKGSVNSIVTPPDTKVLAIPSSNCFASAHLL